MYIAANRRSLSFLVLALLSLLARRCSACVIQGGMDSGECVPGDVFAAKAPFCADTIGGAGNAGYSVCVPKELPWFPNLTTTNKDAWVRAQWARTVARRVAIESGNSPPDVQSWEGAKLDASDYHFTNNADCANAFKNFFCYMNFPRCSPEGASLLVCRSVCQNFFAACRFSDDMNRCYDNPQFYGAATQEADTATDSNGLYIHHRFFLPGMPFKSVEYAVNPTPLIGGVMSPMLVVCTPSLPGGAAAVAAEGAAALALAAAAALLLRPAE